jgi:uncharacterized protein with PIN domain
MPEKFLCNGMLGKLCKFLRMCGIDTEYSNKGNSLILDARKQHRIILTMNTRLRGKDRVFFMETTDPLEQLKAVIRRYHLRKTLRPFSRCLECNRKLTPAKKETVAGKVPFFTLKNFDEYALCESCGKVFWKGTHHRKMVEDLRSVFDQRKNNRS